MDPSEVEHCYFTGKVLESCPPRYEVLFHLKDETEHTKYYMTKSSKELSANLIQQGFIVKDA